MTAFRKVAQHAFTRLGRPAAGVAIAVLGSGCGTGTAQESAPGGAPPPPVTVAAMEAEDVDVQAEYAGRARGSHEVEVRARVEGILERRLYVEGEMVERGTPLFQIDAEPYEIALMRAEAERANARAELNRAEREWNRISELFEQGTASERERDEALSQFELAQAQLSAAEAAVADAERNLRYTEVDAPLSGATDLESFPEGSLIERGTLLTTITRHDPIHVHFALPEDDALAQRAARRARRETQGDHRFAATLILPDGRDYEEQGTVDFTDSTVDPRTGTVSSRAVFPNPEQAVMPGQFVRLRLVLRELSGVIVVPESSVTQGPDGPQVYRVDEQQVARAAPLELGPVVDHGRVVLDGLDAGDRIVVNGQVAVQDGAPVRVGDAAGGGD